MKYTTVKTWPAGMYGSSTGRASVHVNRISVVKIVFDLQGIIIFLQNFIC
jgi:hypothetical protein